MEEDFARQADTAQELIRSAVKAAMKKVNFDLKSLLRISFMD